MTPQKPALPIFENDVKPESESRSSLYIYTASLHFTIVFRALFFHIFPYFSNDFSYVSIIITGFVVTTCADSQSDVGLTYISRGFDLFSNSCFSVDPKI